MQAAATALFIFFGVAMINALIPPAPFNPAWLLRLSTSLIGNGYLALIGLVLVNLAAYLYPKDTNENLKTSLSRWAILASFGFLLLLPLQAWASWNLIQENFSSLERGRPAADEPLQAMEKAIREAPNAADLQTRLTILRGPAIAPQDLARPLPELKQVLLASLQEARANLLRKSRSGPDPRGWVLLQDIIRFSLGALGYAIGFAAFAQRPRAPIPLLDEWKAALPSRRIGPGPSRSSGPWR